MISKLDHYGKIFLQLDDKLNLPSICVVWSSQAILGSYSFLKTDLLLKYWKFYHSLKREPASNLGFEQKTIAQAVSAPCQGGGGNWFKKKKSGML